MSRDTTAQPLERRRRRIQDEIAAYAAAVGGTAEDLDHELEAAASEAPRALYPDETKD